MMCFSVMFMYEKKFDLFLYNEIDWTSMIEVCLFIGIEMIYIFTFFLIWVFVIVCLVKGWDLFGVLQGVVDLAAVVVVVVVGICES